MFPIIRNFACQISSSIFKQIISVQRNFSSKKSETSPNLRDVLAAKIPKERERYRAIKYCLGNEVVDKVKLNQILTGMRGIKSLIYDVSYVDPKNGVSFRGFTIEDCEKKLIKAKGSDVIQPESLFWLLVTGKPPTEEQVECLKEEWRARANVPDYLIKILKMVPKDVHPMAQLSSAVTLMSADSKFAKKYAKGVKKTKYWKYTYEDAMNLIARLPYVAAHIYLNTYNAGKGVEGICVDKNLDWAANFARMICLQKPDAAEMMRLALSIHADNELGNVSAHTVHVVGSALSDAYLSYAAGVNGLAGPLHGLASQEVLTWLHALKKEVGDQPSKEALGKFCEQTLKSGRVIPGFGHAVLRSTDTRYICLRKFCKKRLPDDPMFKLVSDLYEVVPPILKATGKVQNPWPNVDAHSGIVYQHYGLKQLDYYTVLFALSRSLGTMAGLIWSRALGHPIERPKSALSKHLIQIAVEKQQKKGKKKKKGKKGKGKKRKGKKGKGKKGKGKKKKGNKRKAKKGKSKKKPDKKKPSTESICKEIGKNSSKGIKGKGNKQANKKTDKKVDRKVDKNKGDKKQGKGVNQCRANIEKHKK